MKNSKIVLVVFPLLVVLIAGCGPKPPEPASAEQKKAMSELGLAKKKDFNGGD